MEYTFYTARSCGLAVFYIVKIMVAFIMYDIANYSMDETFMKAVNHYIVSTYGENILTEFDYILRKTEH